MQSRRATRNSFGLELYIHHKLNYRSECMQKTPCHPRWSRGRDAAPSERLRQWLRVLALLPGPPPAAPPVARGGAACHTLRAAPLAATTASWTVSWSAAAASSEKHMIRRASVVGVDAFFATWSMTAEPVRWTACTLRSTTLSWTRHPDVSTMMSRCPVSTTTSASVWPSPAAARRSGAAARASISHPLPTEARALRAPRRANTP